MLARWSTRNILAAALAALSTQAHATDLIGPEPALAPDPTFNWTGFHAGINGGYGYNDDNPSYAYTDVPSFVVPLLPNSIDLSGDGGIVGGTFGFDRQMSRLVFGVEGDVSRTNFDGNAKFLNPGEPSFGFPEIEFATSYDMDWFSTIRGRAGLAFDRLFVYGTGGLAIADISFRSSATVRPPGSGFLVGSDSGTMAGWTAGGGGEFALAQHVTLKAEALYYDLGQASLTAREAGNPSSQQVELDIAGAIVRGGIDYKF